MQTNEYTLSSVSFFCPAYNDAGNLPDLIPVVYDFLKRHAGQFEIIIIHDGGRDKTGEVADELATKFPNTRVIHHKKNMGYTATLKEGFEIGQYDYIMYTDGDNQYDVQDFQPYLSLLEHADVITGYAIQKAVSPYRKFQSLFHNTFINVLFRTSYKDINCSMKIFKKDVLSHVHIHSHPYGAFVDAELIIKAQRLGYHIEQFPVTHYERKNGVASGTKPKLIFYTIRDMIKLYFNLL